jgi:UDP-N-acetylglucosamine 2-epimerase (non-hydrolysing)
LEGVPDHKVHFVGNVMIDTLVRLLPLADGRDLRQRLGLEGPFTLVTLHRPSNVDDPGALTRILETLEEIAHHAPVLFPIHPRTRSRISQMGLSDGTRVRMIEPLGYLEFLGLQRDAQLVITDSGGIQEETTFLGIPCITVRENTERPVTLSAGTNVLVGRDMGRLKSEAFAALNGRWRSASVPPLWDGHAGSRIADVILDQFQTV